MNKLKKKYLAIRNRRVEAAERKTHHELVNATLDDQAYSRVKKIGGGYNGSKREFDEVVLKYWSKYGVKPKKFYFDLYCDGKEAYDPRYIPDPVWKGNMIEYFNNRNWRSVVSDKGLTGRMLPTSKRPDTIVKNMNGYYYNGDGDESITMEEAIDLCKNEEHLIIKPSFLSKGKGITFYDRDSSDRIDLEKTFKNLDANFIVQRIVKQHPDLKRLNESSLNTIRIISFRFKGEVYILSALLRMGSAGARIDNVSAGGSAVPIKSDGSLYEKSVNRKSNWTTETPNGIKYADIRIPSYDKLVETCKTLHSKLPYLGIIGWDFAIDESGDPVLIEFNTEPGQNQISCGPTFGDLTEEVLDEVFIKKSMNKTIKYH